MSEIRAGSEQRDCPACGAPAGYPPAGPCLSHSQTDNGRRWIVLEYLTNPVEAAIVTADSEREAAEAGAAFLWEEALERADPKDHPVEPPTRVFVVAWDDRVAYAIDFVANARVAEHQCCGGGPHAEYVNGSGHWGGCPEAPEREGSRS